MYFLSFFTVAISTIAASPQGYNNINSNRNGRGRNQVQQVSKYILDVTVPWKGNAALSVDLGAHFEGKFYQGDRTNGVVHVVDTCSGTYLRTIRGFAGCKDFNTTKQACAEDSSGPNGNVLNPSRGHMWVGDGSGRLQIVDMYSNTIINTIDTGLQSRADELAFDRRNNMIVSTFPGADPPALLFFNADSFENIHKMEFADATDGLEQPTWNRFDGLLYITVPKSKDNDEGELKVIDGSTFQILHTLKEDHCISHGLVIGRRNQAYIGCSEDALTDFGDRGKNSYVIDTQTGSKIFTVQGVSGIDQVNYDRRRQVYLVAAARNQPDPVLAIVSAVDGRTLQTIQTTRKLSHAVAVDEQTGSFMIPAKDGMAIYRPEGSRCNSNGGGQSSSNNSNNQISSGGSTTFSTTSTTASASTTTSTSITTTTIGASSTLAVNRNENNNGTLVNNSSISSVSFSFIILVFSLRFVI